jgi:orotate phosphoribosyltransferase
MDETTKILKEVGALLTDSHFVGVSGRHFSIYINKDALYPHTQYSSRIGELFAEKYKAADIDVVIGPAMGAIILAQWTAFHLSKLKGRDILGVYCDKTPDGGQILKRGYDKLVQGKNVLIVEDLTTTGGSVKQVIDVVRAAGGRVAQVCVMANRDPERVTPEVIGAPFEWLTVIPVQSYDAAECPLCKASVPINTTVGHGKKFLEEQQKNAQGA